MKHIIIFLILVSCSGIGVHLAGAGYAYQQSFDLAIEAPNCILCRDLTDDEMDAADDLPGGGYNDGKWTGENPPACAAQHVWDDGEGNIFILEDDGEITEVAA